MTPEEKKYYATKMLLLFRCGYISGPGISLTKKGKGFLPTWFWRLYNDVMFAISPKHRRVIKGMLNSIDRINKIEALKPK